LLLLGEYYATLDLLGPTCDTCNKCSTESNCMHNTYSDNPLDCGEEQFCRSYNKLQETCVTSPILATWILKDDQQCTELVFNSITYGFVNVSLYNYNFKILW
jgi:hypothetical protein